MKKIVALLLVVVISIGVFSLAFADTLSDFNAKIKSGSPWTKYDYNVTYQKSAKDYLPACINGRKTTINASEVMLFGDGTGAVHAIIGQQQYNVYFTAQGYLVLTSSSEGFGWTGYAIFKPSK